MNLACSWKLKLISNLADPLNDKTWAEILVAEFKIGSARHRLLDMRLQLDVHPVPHSK